MGKASGQLLSGKDTGDGTCTISPGRHPTLGGGEQPEPRAQSRGRRRQGRADVPAIGQTAAPNQSSPTSSKSAPPGTFGSILGIFSEGQSRQEGDSDLPQAETRGAADLSAMHRMASPHKTHAYPPHARIHTYTPPHVDTCAHPTNIPQAHTCTYTHIRAQHRLLSQQHGEWQSRKPALQVVKDLACDPCAARVTVGDRGRSTRDTALSPEPREGGAISRTLGVGAKEGAELCLCTGGRAGTSCHSTQETPYSYGCRTPLGKHQPGECSPGGLWKSSGGSHLA